MWALSKVCLWQVLRATISGLPLPAAMISASVGAALLSMIGREGAGGGVVGMAATGPVGRG